jgi:hypothetical protein
MALAGRGGRIGGLAAALLCLLLLPAARADGLRAAAWGASRVLSPAEVVKAFASSGLRLFDPTAYYDQPIPTLNPLNPPRGYTLGVTVYETVSQATDAYRAIEGGGPSAGVTVAQVRNVLVAVTLTGAALGHKPVGVFAGGHDASATLAMPPPVAESISRLRHESSR